MNKQLQIAFKYSKTGTKMAYRFSPTQVRWFRMGLAEAELLISTEQAREVSYC